jgi:hypothetical protein
MYLIMVALLIVGAGLMKTNIILGASVMIGAILLGDKLQKMTGGDDWLMGLIFFAGIVSVPLMIVAGLLTR